MNMVMLAGRSIFSHIALTAPNGRFRQKRPFARRLGNGLDWSAADASRSTALGTLLPLIEGNPNDRSGHERSSDIKRPIFGALNFRGIIVPERSLPRWQLPSTKPERSVDDRIVSRNCKAL
jgi:hypothetical protein